MLSDSALLGLPAPAKLNLFLHVVGRRPDGKHLLESVFTLIDLHDTIDLFRLEEPVVERTGDVIGNVEKDLCVRAARLLMETFDVRSGVRIHVEKRIPAGAGMGGGSSDAATVLIGLNRLFGLGLSRSALMELGERLGADVPFFIFGRTGFVEGIGEIITPLEIPPCLIRRHLARKGHFHGRDFCCAKLDKGYQITENRHPFRQGTGNLAESVRAQRPAECGARA